MMTIPRRSACSITPTIFTNKAVTGLKKEKSVDTSRVLARNLKMPVQNSNSKFSARPDLATHLLQILIQTTFNSLVYQKGQFPLWLCPRRWFAWEVFGYHPPKYFGQAGRVMAKSLDTSTIYFISTVV